MKLYLGKIAAYKKYIPIFLAVDEKRNTNTRNDEIFLKLKSLDGKWIKNLLSTASKGEKDIFHPDFENQYYLQLYLLFSLRRRLYYSDVKQLTEMEYEKTNLLCQGDVQIFLWKKLCSFMDKNGYQFKIIRSTPSLYEERPFIPFHKYPLREFFCTSAIKMLFQVAKRLMLRYTFYFSTYFSGRFRVNSTGRKISTKYANVKNIKSSSQSGCLFFSADNENGDKLFIKIGTVHGADIENEYAICKLLKANTNRSDLYLLPELSESSPNQLVFPFVNGCSLKEVMKKRELTSDEVKKLQLFLTDVIADLSNCRIVHRDIHFDNILCSINAKTGSIDRFLLSDFGCAVTEDMDVPDNTLRQKRKNQYAGSLYRYSRYTWDDAASAAYVVMQNINIDLIDWKSENELISCIGKHIYMLK